MLSCSQQNTADLPEAKPSQCWASEQQSNGTAMLGLSPLGAAQFATRGSVLTQHQEGKEQCSSLLWFVFVVGTGAAAHQLLVIEHKPSGEGICCVPQSRKPHLSLQRPRSPNLHRSISSSSTEPPAGGCACPAAAAHGPSHVLLVNPSLAKSNLAFASFLVPHKFCVHF